MRSPMFRRSFLFVVALALVAGGCASIAKPAKTQLETRELQTRTFDTNDEKLVMAEDRSSLGAALRAGDSQRRQWPHEYARLISKTVLVRHMRLTSPPA